MSIFSRIRGAIVKVGRKIAHAFGLVTKREAEEVAVQVGVDAKAVAREEFDEALRVGKSLLQEWWKKERNRRKDGKKGTKPTDEMLEAAGS